MNLSVVRTMYFRPRVAAISSIGVKDNETTLESDSRADTFVLGGVTLVKYFQSTPPKDKSIGMRVRF